MCHESPDFICHYGLPAHRCGVFLVRSPSTQSMVPAPTHLQTGSTGKSVCVAMFAGGNENQGALRVSGTQWMNVVAASLEKTSMFTQVQRARESGTDYTLKGAILGQPVSGAVTCSASLFVQYRLMNNTTGEQVAESRISGNGKATFSDAAVGVKRLRIAIERSAQDNAAQLINWLDSLDL